MFVPDKTKFRNSMNGLYIRRVFLETSYRDNDKTPVQYTLRSSDHPEGYPSLYKLYIQMGDPLEYQFAETYLESYEHWMKLCETSWFRPIVERWRNDLQAKLKTAALQKILRVSEDDTHKNQFEALKIILAGGWKEKETKRRAGRPSKEEVQGHLKQSVNEEKELLEELKRVEGNED
jgi:hypothetical protein